jgi:D-lactate dehydrogenase
MLQQTKSPVTEQALLDSLRAIVGASAVATGRRKTQRYVKGFREGGGDAQAVVFPSTLLQLWQVLQACVAADRVVIMQAANTGLTGGSTPTAEGYDRAAVVINTLRMDTIRLLDGGKQIVSFPGGTLYKLERMLKPLGREPHSVIGSSCIGASIVGGVCNNSGGSLVHRGPAYTELALYAQIDASGTLKLVNHLGIDLGSTPEEILTKLENGTYTEADIRHDDRRASGADYTDRMRDVDADTPARWNADPSKLYEASGCAGKLAVFAARLDTFGAETKTQVYYIGTNDTAVLTDLRRRLLGSGGHLPIAGEYMHRDIYDVSAIYGKDTFWLIKKYGTEVMPGFFALKSRVDATLANWSWAPRNLSDRIAQFFAKLLPKQLPDRLNEWRDRYEHHLMLKMAGPGIAEAEALLKEVFADSTQGGWFTCTPEEGSKAFLHRFAAAGAAIRYQAVHADEVEDILALDIALKRSERQWFETLPPEVESQLVSKLYYGHFLCHVFHQDYIVKKGVDAKALKKRMLEILDSKGAEYPAEHNVGHLYYAKPALAAFYREVDPTNTLNPGLGKLPRGKFYAEEA